MINTCIDKRLNLYYNKHYCESLFTFVNIKDGGHVFHNTYLIK